MAYATDVLTAKGFRRILYPEYLEMEQNRARELFGEDVDLGDESPLGQWCKMLAFDRAEENELAERVYLSANVDNAEGVALDYAVKRGGITRFPAKKASATQALKVTISPGDTLDAGFLAAKANGVTYRTTIAAVDADGDGIAYADVEAVEAGSSGNADVGEVLEIKTPTAGVTGVTNVIAITGGRYAETDAALRSRYYKSIAKGGSSTTDSITASLLEISDVRAAITFENDADTTDAEGRPPHSVAPVVLGGTPEEIGKAILSTKAGGIKSYGSESVTVKDNSGIDKVMGYSYATTVPVYANVTVYRNALFPTDGANTVEQQVIEFIGGKDIDDAEYPGLGMGEDVVHARLIRAIAVRGLDDLIITMRKGDTGEFTSDNIEIGSTEVAETSAARVVVTVV
jgi:uncharacterized phage protein gp47/JayE